MFGKRKIAALVAEFLATGVLTLVILSVQRSQIGVPYFVALAAGLVAAMAMFVFGSVSGAHANPAITLALWTARKVSTVTALLYVVVQLLGGWTAYAVYTYFIQNSLQAIPDNDAARLVVAEAVGALVLALGWGAVAFRKNLTVGNRAAIIGLSYALAVIVAAGASVGVINPAVAIGLRAWEFLGFGGLLVYAAGPLLGAVIGVNLYGLLFADSDRDETGAMVVEEVVVAETVTEPSVSNTAAPKRKTTTRKASSTARKTAATTSRKKPGPKPKSTTRSNRK